MADEIKPIGHLDGGLTPIFLFEGTNQAEFIEKIYEETGETQFYLLGHETITFKKEGTNTQTSQFQPRFFLVNYSTIGYTCDAIELRSFNDRLDSFGKVLKETANFALPKIPSHLVAEIDGFFRYVHEKNKTEGIVILTYDPNLVGDDENKGLGWGYQIPTQQNTAGRCDYEADSIIEHMEESAYVVGSAHSHPMMSAFCSSVDKQDQANFPGVHITFAWGDKGSDPSVTQHHCEFQLGDQAWTLKPQQIFAEPPLADLPDEIKKVADERVTKSAPKTPSKSKNHWPGHGGHPGSTNKDSKKKQQQPKKYYEKRSPNPKSERVNLPEELKEFDWNMSTNVLVWSPLLRTEDMEECPCCDAALSKDEVQAFRCGDCHTYIHGVDKNFSDILEHRRGVSTLPFAGLSMNQGQVHTLWYVIEQYKSEDENETYLEVEMLHKGTVDPVKKKKVNQ